MLFPAKARVALVGLVVAGGAAAAVTLGPAGAAVGQSSVPIQTQIQLGPTATLVAKGAAVDVSVTASCSGQDVTTGNIGISITEAVGKNLASGSAGATISCTGTTQTFDLLATPESGRSFTKGVALATASIDACTTDFFNCGNQTIQATITIGK